MQSAGLSDTIHDGDIIFGDVNGVLVIPKETADEVIEKALDKATMEKTLKKIIEDGMLVTDAYKIYGVHISM